MAKSDYIPPGDIPFRDLLKHLSERLGTHKATLGLGDPEVAALTADYNDFKAKLETLDAAETAYDSAAAAKKTCRASVEPRLRALGRRIKAAAGYTEAIGAALKLIGSEDSTNLNAERPVITGKALPGGEVEISFVKGKSDGVLIETCDDGAANWTFLARDTCSPYVDNRPLRTPGKPESRRYRAIYVKADDRIGQFSDEVTVVARP